MVQRSSYSISRFNTSAKPARYSCSGRSLICSTHFGMKDEISGDIRSKGVETQGLFDSTIKLKPQQDTLVWSRIPKNGLYTACLGYTTTFLAGHLEEPWWWKKIWKIKAPMKARLFLWLSLSNKVLLGMYYTRELGSSQALSTLKLVGTMGGYQTPFDGLSLFTRRLGCSMNLERG